MSKNYMETILNGLAAVLAIQPDKKSRTAAIHRIGEATLPDHEINSRYARIWDWVVKRARSPIGENAFRLSHALELEMVEINTKPRLHRKFIAARRAIEKKNAGKEPHEEDKCTSD